MKKLFLVFMMVIALLAIPIAAMADSSVTFIWNANTTDADLAGYRIFESPTSGGQVMDPALAIATILAGTETVTLQVADGPHYWVIAPYDTSGNQADKSAEVSAVLDSIPPDVTTGFQITVIIKVTPIPIPE